MDESEKKMTDPYPKSWFQMYNEERQKRKALEAERDELKENLDASNATWFKLGIAQCKTIKRAESAESRLDKVENAITNLRDYLYEELPTGDIEAFDLIKLVKGTIETLEKMEEALRVGEDKKCPICGESASIRNPTGKCDHLYYPENLDPEKLLLIFKVLEAELQKTEDQVTCEKFAITEGIRDRQKAEENLRIAELYIKNMQEVNKIYEHRLAEAEPSPEMASLILRGLGYISPIPILQPQSEDFKRHIDYLRKKSLRGVVGESGEEGKS